MGLDIKELDEAERRLLVAVLYQLANDEGGWNLTDYQKKYIRRLCILILNLKVINLLKFYTYLNFNVEYLIVINKQKKEDITLL